MAVATAKKKTGNGGKTDPKHNIRGSRQAYYDNISDYNLAPLW